MLMVCGGLCVCLGKEILVVFGLWFLFFWDFEEIGGIGFFLIEWEGFFAWLNLLLGLNWVLRGSLRLEGERFEALGNLFLVGKLGDKSEDGIKNRQYELYDDADDGSHWF